MSGCVFRNDRKSAFFIVFKYRRSYIIDKKSFSRFKSYLFLFTGEKNALTSQFKHSANLGRKSIDGRASPFSHFDTDCGETVRKSAICFCDSSCSKRILFRLILNINFTPVPI